MGFSVRILLTVHQFLPEYCSGTEMLTYWTARALRALGHEVRVLTASLDRARPLPATPLDTYEHEGFSVYRFHPRAQGGGHPTNPMVAEYDNPAAARACGQILAEFCPDVVHCFHLSRLSASLIDTCKASGTPIVLTATDYWLLCPTTQLHLPDGTSCPGPDGSGVNCLRHLLRWTGRTRWAALAAALPQGALARAISACRAPLLRGNGLASRVRALADRAGFLRARLNALDRVLVPTRLMGRLLTDQGLDPARIVYCPFGIPEQPPRSQDKPLGFPASSILRVGFIGTFVEHKGAHILIAAVRRLSHAPIQLSLYGNGRDFPEYASGLKEQAKGDERIRFLGTFASEDLGEVLAGLDVLVVPSLWYENTPLVVLSAQGVGCPVVATNVPGLSEVLSHESNGLLFTPGDVEGLARLLQRLLHQPELLGHLRRNARAPKSIATYATECLALYGLLTPAGRGASAAQPSPVPAHPGGRCPA